ncbi:hypothetical protein SAMN02746089_02172, partial [Caldanaerobius fijiensis DSM 17918]
MSILTKEQLKNFISENNIQSIPDLYASLKNLFKDTIQEMLEAELSTELGYEKYEKK